MLCEFDQSVLGSFFIMTNLIVLTNGSKMTQDRFKKFKSNLSKIGIYKSIIETDELREEEKLKNLGENIESSPIVAKCWFYEDTFGRKERFSYLTEKGVKCRVGFTGHASSIYYYTHERFLRLYKRGAFDWGLTYPTSIELSEFIEVLKGLLK